MKGNQFGIARALWLLCVLSIFFAAWSYLTFATGYRRFMWAWGATALAVAAIGAVQLTIKHRRWFQYNLSTWFVLVTILAWAMLYWPWVTRTTAAYPYPIPRAVAWRCRVLAKIGVYPSNPQAYNVLVEQFDPNPNSSLLYPAIALAAFISWKAAWRIVERQRKRLGSEPP